MEMTALEQIAAAVALAERMDITGFTDADLVRLLHAGLGAVDWFADDAAELPEGVQAGDIAAAWTLGPRAFAELQARHGHAFAAFFLRHHATPAAELEAEHAVGVLVQSVAVKLSASHRIVLEHEEDTGGDPRAVADAAIAAQLVETVTVLVDPDPSTAFSAVATGQLDHVALAVANDLRDEGRKRHTSRERAQLTAATLEITGPAKLEPEVFQEQDHLEPQAAGHPLLARVPAAVAELKASGARMTQENLARTLGVTSRYLRRIRSETRSA
jgi:hypothetical protein